MPTSFDDSEMAKVRSNLRRFRTEEFRIWRCPVCRSIHAVDDVDLAHYYRGYPALPEHFEQRLDPIYANQLRRLNRFGLKREDRILDFGCGPGHFVQYLKRRGYVNAVGYDAYAAGHGDRSVLKSRYHCVFSQDVLEHVDSPLETLRQFNELTEPGGLVFIGTPDADAIALTDPEAFVHILHAPYHRHILSAQVLITASEKLGWKLEHFFPTVFSNTLVPGQNTRFGLYYLAAFDDCLDLVTEPIRLNSWKLWSPTGLFFFLFGFFFDPKTDVAFAFRTSGGPDVP